MIPEALTQAQFDTVYNILSLTLAAQLFGAIFLLVSSPGCWPDTGRHW
jgi:hypothetical protein